MKSLALLILLSVILGGATLGSAATLNTTTQSSAPNVTHQVSVVLPAIGFIKAHRVLLPQQATTPTPSGTTPTPGTPAPTDTPGPTATPTGPTYPDPVTLLQKTISVFGLLRTVHFENITDGEQTGTEKLRIDAIGDATCKGPAFLAHIRGKDTLEGTSQSRSVNYFLIQYGSKDFTKGSKANSTWKSTKPNKATAFGFSTDNPLACPNASSSGGSSGSSQQIKNLVNLGPETFHGVQVWHVRATQVSIDQQTGNSSDSLIDFYISQDHFLPYGYNVTVDDTKNGVKLSLAQILTKFGEKVSVSKPKIGSKKP